MTWLRDFEQKGVTMRRTVSTIALLAILIGCSRTNNAQELNVPQFHDRAAAETYLGEIDNELQRRYAEHFKVRVLYPPLSKSAGSDELSGVPDTDLIQTKIAIQKTIYCNVKGVYACDDRRESLSGITRNSHRELARSAVVLVQRDKARKNGDTWHLYDHTLERDQEVCAEEAYKDQPVPGFCSGFLVRQDVIATAGHCISKENMNDVLFVFNFSLNDGQPKLDFSSDEVYFAKEIIARKLDNRNQDDWAIVRLDRSVVGVPPAPLRTTGNLSDETTLCVVGHPLGLPQKYACNAKPMENTNPVYFLANLDTFGGNSGSMVFNADTAIVEGILVRGDQDFSYDTRRKCAKSVICPANGGCSGEGVTRISRMLQALP